MSTIAIANDSTRAKKLFIGAMEDAINGRVGEWAREVQVLIRYLKANFNDEQAFKAADKQWKRLEAMNPPTGVVQLPDGRMMVVYQ